MNGQADETVAATQDASRRPLPPADGDAFLRTSLEAHFPAMASLAFQVRGLVRTQLLTASEEITLRADELFLGYSVHSYARDPIASLTVSGGEIILAFARGIPAAGENSLRSRRMGADNLLRITDATAEDLMILKVLVREAGRTSRPRLPVGRSGQCFLVQGSAGQ